MKPEILTYTGKTFDYLNPNKEQVCIEDIAHALSNICRFTGHTRKFYSVAQHCVLASYLVPFEYALQALMHDATEAYCNDIAKPLKMILRDYQIIETKVEKVIFEKFGLPPALDESVKHADLRMLVTEQRDCLAIESESWLPEVEPLINKIEFWPSSEAKIRFLRRYDELA